MDVDPGNLDSILEPRWAHFGRKKNVDTAQKIIELMQNDKLRSLDDGPMKR